jgi:hypothetical protein
MDDTQELTPSWKWPQFKTTMTPGHLLYRYWSFGNTCWFHLHGRRVSSILWDFRFLHQCFWGFISFWDMRLCYCVNVGWLLRKLYHLHGPLDPRRWRHHQQPLTQWKQHHIPDDLNPHPRPWSSYSLLIEPQISRNCAFFLSGNYFVVSNLYYVYLGNYVSISWAVHFCAFSGVHILLVW